MKTRRRRRLKQREKFLDSASFIKRVNFGDETSFTRLQIFLAPKKKRLKQKTQSEKTNHADSVALYGTGIGHETNKQTPEKISSSLSKHIFCSSSNYSYNDGLAGWLALNFSLICLPMFVNRSK